MFKNWRRNIRWKRTWGKHIVINDESIAEKVYSALDNMFFRNFHSFLEFFMMLKLGNCVELEKLDSEPSIPNYIGKPKKNVEREFYICKTNKKELEVAVGYSNENIIFEIYIKRNDKRVEAFRKTVNQKWYESNFYLGNVYIVYFNCHKVNRYLFSIAKKDIPDKFFFHVNVEKNCGWFFHEMLSRKELYKTVDQVVSLISRSCNLISLKINYMYDENYIFFRKKYIDGNNTIYFANHNKYNPITFQIKITEGPWELLSYNDGSIFYNKYSKRPESNCNDDAEIELAEDVVKDISYKYNYIYKKFVL